MHPDDLDIGEHDLLAYVDNQLPLDRRAEVEAWLAARPDEAARVMADLSTRDALRAALGAPVPASPVVRGAAAALTRRFARGGALDGLRRAAAVVILVGAGWFAHAFVAAPTTAVAAHPAFVEDAVHAYRTAVLRAGLAQPQAHEIDRAELARGTGIALPELPRTWRIEDVQVFPSHDGPSIEVTVDAAERGRLFLFAAVTDGFDVISPVATRTEAGETVYWQVGRTAYALSGSLPEREIREEAVQLASSLY